MSKIDVAKHICMHFHKHQKDKAGKPYYIHPFSVAEKLKTEDEKIVAYLHDVLEDTNCTKNELSRIFDKKIVDAIEVMTHDKSEKYEDYLKRVKNNPIALRVKLADINHNMDVLRYEEIDDTVRKRMKKYINALNYLLDL